MEETDSIEAAAEASPRPRVDADVILKAPSQLLVEKGILTRQELVDRIGSLADSEGAG